MDQLSRRQLLRTAPAAGVALIAANRASAEDVAPPHKLKGNLKQSVCAWCYSKIPLDDLARAAAEIGLSGIDLLQPTDFPTIQKYGLICPMVMGPGGIAKGWNDPGMHEELITKGQVRLREVAAAGYPNMIVLSGNRFGMTDDVGLKNCVEGLKHLTPLAEELGVNIVMELLNSKKDHKDYMCDHTRWGVDLCEAIASPRFKLLYDIYHMQIMEGDVIQTIRDHHQHIAHYHTGGVPGRNEIDTGQELYYPRICAAILETGFTGHLAQEFIPKRDPIASLREAALLCDV